jgi:aspartyl-tRNA(Asn)/glutamyl-tRNA(Gln) amidotransferase subunit C
MKVTEKDVRYVEDLANLELTPQERERMLKDLNSILEYIDRLNQFDTRDVPPMAQTSDRYGVDQSKIGSARFAYVLREDQVDATGQRLERDTVLRNAPESDGTFFKVSKVIEK